MEIGNCFEGGEECKRRKGRELQQSEGWSNEIKAAGRRKEGVGS